MNPIFGASRSFILASHFPTRFQDSNRIEIGALGKCFLMWSAYYQILAPRKIFFFGGGDSRELILISGCHPIWLLDFDRISLCCFFFFGGGGVNL